MVNKFAERQAASNSSAAPGDPLQDSELRFQTLAECLPDDFFLHDDQGTFLNLNERACLSLGYTREELLRMNVGDISVARTPGEREELWRRAQPGKVITLQSLHRRKDGSVFPVEVRVSCQQLGGRKLFFGVAHDISERVKAETIIQELNRELEQRVSERTRELKDMTDALQAVMDSANDAIFLKDTQGRFLLFNRAAERFSGFTAADVIGKTAIEAFGPETGGVIMAQEQTVLAQGETTTVEETLTMKGTQRVFLATRSPRKNAAGEISGLVGVSRDITDRKVVENELRTQRDRLKLAAQVGGLGIWDYHIDTDTLYCDERWYQIVGRSPAHPIRSIGEFTAFIHPEDVARATEVNLATLAELIASNRNYSIVFRIMRPDGETRWLRSAACLVQGTTGTAARAIGIVIDITESHLADEKLQRSYQSLLEAERLARIGSWRLDLATRRFSCSDMLYELNGADPAGPPLTLSDISRLFTQEGQQIVSAAIERCASTGEPFDLNVQHLRVDGAPFAAHLRGQANRDSSGTIVAVSGTAQDITEREEARARLAALADNLPSGIIFLLERRDGQKPPVLTYVSAGIEKLIGISASELVAGRETFSQIILEEDRARFAETLAAAATTLNVFDCQFRARARNGRLMWMHMRAAPRLQSYGSTVWDGILRDITLEHEAAEALKAAKEAAEAAEQTKSDFLATMSHELRTPMSAVMGMARLALKTELSDKQRHYLERIDASGGQLVAIINDVLDFSKIEAGRLELEDIPFTLESLLDSVTNIIAVRAEEKGLEIVYSIAAAVPRKLCGDPLRLSQVLTNLIGNAVKFTEQGKIVISIELAPGGPEDCILQFSVRDTGIGMDADQLSGLFRPFTQADAGTSRRYGGTGLGLAICKRLVERMDGRIWVKSLPGEGSTFHFTVALRDARESREPAPQLQTAADTTRTSNEKWPALSGRRVLVVDDQAVNRELAADLLSLIGMTVDTACSGAEALERIRHMRYDAVIMDIHMPEMNGIETVRQMRAQAGRELPPVVAFTAQARVEDFAASRDAGMTAHITKPIDETRLYQTLSEVLTRAGTSRT